MYLFVRGEDYFLGKKLVFTIRYVHIIVLLNMVKEIRGEKVEVFSMNWKWVGG